MARTRPPRATPPGKEARGGDRVEPQFLQTVCRAVAEHAAREARRRRLAGEDDPVYGLSPDPAAVAAFDPEDALAGCRACAAIYDQIAVWVARPAYRREISSAVGVLSAVFWGYARLAGQTGDPAVAAEVACLAERFR